MVYGNSCLKNTPVISRLLNALILNFRYLLAIADDLSLDYQLVWEHKECFLDMPDQAREQVCHAHLRRLHDLN